MVTIAIAATVTIAVATVTTIAVATVGGGRGRYRELATAAPAERMQPRAGGFFGPFSDLFRTFFGPLGPDLGDVLRVELSDLCVVDQALLKGGGDNGGGRSRKGSGRSGGGSGRPGKGSEN